MGDLQDWSPEASGSNLEDRSSSSSSSNREVAGEESWRRAEEVTQGIIAKIQPNTVAEERRRAVIDYVQRLLRGYLRVEVFPFGSVPLKTYLPDGDIDLTAFKNIEEEAFANEVLSVLRTEEQNGAAEFVVKDVQHIRAEVQLVKCIVQNIVVDISFNQLGGLSTLCFLEKVDRLIGKNNLLKRSIILIKAWCYYESRVLGAHHGLISTYALETLVLYIFNNFHSSLDGPLAVLYKFLDHYSKFDWDRYCVSLKGPILVSSLPEIVVETSEKQAEPLLSSDFLRECVEMFSIPSRALGLHSRTFLAKNLNIVDPLKESNNLGRSVSRGNLVRIRSAFALGARKLEKILSQSEETLGDEVLTFFTSTLDRHGSGVRPDIQDNVLNYGFSTYSINMPFQYPQPPHEDQYTAFESPSPVALDGFLNYGNPETGKDIPGTSSQQSFNPVLSANLAESGLSSGNSICERRLSGDASNLTSPRTQTPTEGSSHLVSDLDHHPPPHLNFSNEDLINGNLERENSEDASISLSPGCSSSQMAAVRSGPSFPSSPIEDPLASNQTTPPPPPSVELKNQRSQLSPSSEDFVPRHHGLWAQYRAEPTRILPQLEGDYESQLSSLQIGRRWFDFAMGVPAPPISPQFVSPFHGKKLWDVVKQSVHKNQGMLSQMSVSAPLASPGTGFHPRSPPTPPLVPSFDDKPKPRGTGTYFPMNQYRERNSFNWARNQTPAFRSPRFNARSMTFPEANFKDRRDVQPLQTRERYGSSSDHQQIEIKAPLGPNGATVSSEKDLQFGSYKEPPTSSPESSKNPIAVTNSAVEPVFSAESSQNLIAVTNSVTEPVSLPEGSKSLIAVTNSLKEPVSLPESSRNPIAVINSIGSYKEAVSSSESSKNQVAVTNPVGVTNLTAVTNSVGSYKERLSSTESSKIQIALTNPVAVANSIGNSSRQVFQWPRPPGSGANPVRIPVQSYHLKDDDDFPPLSV